MRKVTIDDISRDTGLSRGTVSRALNNRPDISVETRSRVLASCTKLNYVPSHAARTLATGRNFTLLVLIDDLQSPQSAAALRGVLGVVSPAHYFVHVIELNARAGAAERIRAISGERIDGAVVLAPLDAEAVGALRSMLDQKPSASIFRIENLAADVFQPDHLEAGRAAARRLIEDGIRRAGYVHRGGRGWSERLRGFCEIWGAQGRSDDAMHVIDLAVSRLAPGELNGCEAVVFDESHLVARLLLADGPLSDRKLLTIGDAAGWIGGAPCTIVDCAAEEIGRRAAHALLQRIDHNREDAPQLVHVAPHVVEPESPSGVRSAEG